MRPVWVFVIAVCLTAATVTRPELGVDRARVAHVHPRTVAAASPGRARSTGPVSAVLIDAIAAASGDGLADPERDVIDVCSPARARAAGLVAAIEDVARGPPPPIA